MNGKKKSLSELFEKNKRMIIKKERKNLIELIITIRSLSEIIYMFLRIITYYINLLC